MLKFRKQRDLEELAAIPTNWPVYLADDGINIDVDVEKEIENKPVVLNTVESNPIPLSSTPEDTIILREIKTILEDQSAQLQWFKKYATLVVDNYANSTDAKVLYEIRELVKDQTKQLYFLSEIIAGAITRSVEVRFPAISNQIQTNNSKEWVVKSCRDFTNPVPLQNLLSALEGDGWTIHSIVNNSSDVIFVTACRDR